MYASVYVGACVWAMIPHFALWKDCWCCDCSVKWLSSVQSDIHTNVFPLFSSAGPIEILEIQVEGMLVAYTLRPWLIREGRTRAEAKHQPCFLHKALTAVNHQETRSSRQIHTLTFEHCCARLLWKWGQRNCSHTDRWIYSCGVDIFAT